MRRMRVYVNITKGEYKMKKKNLLTVVLALVMTIGACFTCFAAEAGVSAKEQEILDALKAGVTLQNGTTVQLPANYYNMAQNYLATDGNNLTNSTVDATLEKIADIKSTIVATGVASAADLKTLMSTDNALAATLAEKATAAGRAAGITEFDVSFTGDGFSLGVSDPTGKIKADDSAVIKDTGFSYATTAAAALAVVAVLGGCVVVARKNNLFAQEA